MEFLDFTLLLSSPRRDGNILHFSVQVPTAADLPAIAEPVEASCDLGALQPILAADGRAVEWTKLQAAGRELGKALLPGPVTQRLRQALARVDRRAVGLRLRILGAVVVQRLPWEYCILEPEYGEPTKADFLSLVKHVAIVRDQEGVARSAWAPRRLPALRIVGCAAAPRGTAALALERERAALEEALAKCPDAVLRWTSNGRRPASSSGSADMFHFAGHGGFEPAGSAGASGTRDIVADDLEIAIDEPGAGMLMFDDGNGGQDRMYAADLGVVLREMDVRIAVLNACKSASRDVTSSWSSTAAALLNSGVRCVVAMQHAVLDQSAIIFSTAFYRAVSAGDPLEIAVHAGRLAIFESGDSVGWGTPVLYLSSTDGRVFPALALHDAPGATVSGWTSVPARLSWSSDGKLLAASDDGACWMWKHEDDWRLSASRSGLAKTPYSCAWLDHRLVVARECEIELVDAGRPQRFASTENAISRLVAAGVCITCIDVYGGLYAFESTLDGARVMNRAPSGASDWSHCVMSPRGEVIALANADGDIVIWGASRKLARTNAAEGVRGLAFLGEAALAVLLANGAVAVFSVEKKALRRGNGDLLPASTMFEYLAAAPRASSIALATSTSVELYSLSDGHSPRRVATLAIREVRCIALARDGRSLAVGTSTGLGVYATENLS